MLKKRLYSLRMVEGGDVLSHIQLFDHVSNKLLNFGVNMEEKDKSLLLLCLLPLPLICWSRHWSTKKRHYTIKILFGIANE